MIPSISYRPEIGDLFANFALNWKTLLPVMAVLLGVYFGSYLAGKIKDMFYGE